VCKRTRAETEPSWKPAVNAAEIGVEVKDGIVTLAGHVSSHAEKFGAERAAQRVAGLRALGVEIDIKLPGMRLTNPKLYTRVTPQVRAASCQPGR
jgi:hypothetical protein